MRIETYSYGRMTIGGKIYQKDLIIFPDRIIPAWWRREGHCLNLEDLADVLKVNPELIIVGKGSSGFMKVPLAVKLALKEKGIEVIDKNTDRAAEVFNEQSQMGKKVVGVFHLTC